ncbi:MAG: sugar phosphate isomerase/epimerase [Verrucomicrobiota bacterium]
MNRRHFLRSSASTAFALSAGPAFAALAADDVYRKTIGLQLYTLRNEIKADTAGTIKAVAAAGYKQGEMYGFPNCGPMIAAARDCGLELHSSHFEWDSVVNPKDDSLSDFLKILDKAREAGLSHLVIPYLADGNRRTLDDYKKVAANANKAAAKAKEAGIQLAYHNHNFEFEPKEGGKRGFDILMEEFSPDMKFEVDIFWVKIAGLEPVDLLKKLSGRVSQVHLKDLKSGIPTPAYSTGLPADAFKELGNGTIPLEPVLAAAKEAGVKICHVEQDQSPAPLKSIQQSMDYLRKL